MLDERQYSLEQARLAEAWILVGDWSMKGVNPTLELSDFYPSPDQVESTRAKLKPSLVIVERSKLRRGYQAPPPTATSPQPDSRGLLREIIQLRDQLYDAEQELAEARRTIEALTAPATTPGDV